MDYSGIVADVKHDDEIEQYDQDQASVKQSLISSYKKNLYPALKEDIQKNNIESLVFTSQETSRSKWKFHAHLIEVSFPFHMAKWSLLMFVRFFR